MILKSNCSEKTISFMPIFLPENHFREARKLQKFHVNCKA